MSVVRQAKSLPNKGYLHKNTDLYYFCYNFYTVTIKTLYFIKIQSIGCRPFKSPFIKVNGRKSHTYCDIEGCL